MHRLNIRALVAITVVALAACSDPVSQPTNPVAPTGPARQEVPPDLELAVRDRYIVVFTDAVQDPASLAAQLVGVVGGTLGFTYEFALKGFSALLPTRLAVETLRRNPAIAFIEPVQVGRGSAVETQSPGPSWGIDRVDQRTLPRDNTFRYGTTGVGTRAYIIDSGIDVGHPDFGGRASIGADFVGDGRNGSDCHGHGTHVAGTTGGATFGVAKRASLVAVRVLRCDNNGTTESFIAGIDWVRANHVKPAVANFSIQHAPSAALDLAVRSLIASGVTFVTIATNSFQGFGGDACQWSPARVREALTVAAIRDDRDFRAEWSGFGSCVDLFAPGEGVTSSVLGGSSAAFSGTSMAAPHVSGAVARYLETNPVGTPVDASAFILATATPGVVQDAQGSPNLLLYVDPNLEPPVAPTPTPPTNQAPQVTITEPAVSTLIGVPAAIQFTVSDPDGNPSALTCTIDYGDGTVRTEPCGATTLVFKEYAAAGTFLVRLTAVDPLGAATTAVATEVVTDPATLNRPPVVFNLRTVGDGPFTTTTKNCYGRYTICLRFAFRDDDQNIDSPWRAEFDWGDGSVHVPNTLVQQSTSLLAPHDYTNPGTYTVRVRIVDRRGLSGEQTITFTVGAP